MQHKFLITTAAAALVAGTLFAAAQSGPKGPAGGAPGAGPPAAGEERGDRDRGARPAEPKRGAPKSEEPSTRGQGGPRSEERREGAEPRDGAPKAGEPKREGGKEAPKAAEPKGGAKDAPKTAEPKGGAKDAPKTAEPKREGKDAPKTAEPKREEGAPKAAEGDRTRGSVTFTAEQRTRIRETVIKSGPRVTNVNFTVRVGTEVPRTVRVVEVPDVIIEIHPEYRGHFYFVYNDEIIILDRNHRIIAIIEV